MARRGKTRKQEEDGSPGATVQDDAGGHSGRSSPSAAGASSSFPSPSQTSEFSPSPEKARQKSTRRVPVGGARETSQPISAAPLGTFAQMSKARVPASTIRLIHEAPESAGGNSAKPVSTMASAAPARKALSGGSHVDKSASVATNAEDLSGDDQHTQDANGQEAAPDMHFEVNIHTSCVHAQMIVCACSFASNC